MTSSTSAAADRTHGMMQDAADHWGLVVVIGVDLRSARKALGV